MVIECCSWEGSYSTFYGLIGERFYRLNRIWFDCFGQAFREYYETFHRYGMGCLWNIERFKDPEVGISCRGVSAPDNPKDTRFSIIYIVTTLRSTSPWPRRTSGYVHSNSH